MITCEINKPLQYDNAGRLMFHPYWHKRDGKVWTKDELIYLCKWHDKDKLENLTFALSRSYTALDSKLGKLKKDGKYWLYKNWDGDY